MATRKTKSDKNAANTSHARPAPDFSELHTRWEEKFKRGKEKYKKTTELQATVRHGPTAHRKTYASKSLIPQCGISASTSIKSQPSHPHPRKKTALGHEYVEFKADPRSLAQILCTDSSVAESNHHHRPSVYDRLSKGNKMKERDERAVSMFASARTPLKNILNCPDTLSPPCGARKSIYDVISQRQTAERSAKMARKIQLLTNGGAKPLTSAVKLSANENASERDAVKLKLFDEAGDDQLIADEYSNELDESLMKAIREAERKLDAKMAAERHSGVNVHDSITTNKPDSSSSRHPSACEPTPLDIDYVLSSVAGISRLPQTPERSESICMLKGSVSPMSNHEKDSLLEHCSPVLAPPSYRPSIGSVAKGNDLVEEEVGEVNSDCHYTHTHELAGSPTVVRSHISPKHPSTDMLALSHQTDNLTSDRLSNALQSLVKELKSSRGRSTDVLSKPLDCMDLERELNEILTQQRMLDERKRMLLEKFSTSQPHTLPLCSAGSSAKETMEKEVNLVTPSVPLVGVKASANCNLSGHLAEKCEVALLNEEVAIYTCTMTCIANLAMGRQLSNPVAAFFNFGDRQHFIPIPEDTAWTDELELSP